MNARRPITWLLVVGLSLISGVAVGSLLDWLFWQISYDYVYPRHQFVVSGTKVAFVLGSLAAAIATAGSPAPAKLRTLTIMWIATLVSAVLFGCLAGLIGYGFAKWIITDSGAGSLAPRTRVWFCEGLHMGTLCGAAAAACVCNFVLVQQRFKRPRNPQNC